MCDKLTISGLHLLPAVMGCVKVGPTLGQDLSSTLQSAKHYTHTTTAVGASFFIVCPCPCRGKLACLFLEQKNGKSIEPIEKSMNGPIWLSWPIGKGQYSKTVIGNNDKWLRTLIHGLIGYHAAAIGPTLTIPDKPCSIQGGGFNCGHLNLASAWSNGASIYLFQLFQDAT